MTIVSSSLIIILSIFVSSANVINSKLIFTSRIFMKMLIVLVLISISLDSPYEKYYSNTIPTDNYVLKYVSPVILNPCNISQFSQKVPLEIVWSKPSCLKQGQQAGYSGPCTVRFCTSPRWEETPQLGQPLGNLFQGLILTASPHVTDASMS